MRDVAFWFEFRRRADVLIWLVLIHPPLLGLYALIADLGRPAIEVWFIGLGFTFLFSLLCVLVIYAATEFTIRRGIDFVTREKAWMDLARRGPQARVIADTAEAG